MKKNYAVVSAMMAFLSLSTLKSQTADTSVATATNTIFAPLEKNRVPNNILLDYGMELIDITIYDGVLRTTNYVDAAIYRDAYSTLASSCTAAGVPGIVAPMTDELAAKSGQKGKNLTSKGTSSANMVLSGLYYNYSRFRSDALSTNKITVVNNTYVDKYINGVWQNPYESKTAFVISTPVLELNKANLSLSLPTNLWHTNQASGYTNIEVDFGNGTGYKTLFNNTSANSTYSSVGIYTLTYRLRMTNGTYLYCRQKLDVKNVSPTTTSKGTLPIDEVNITATRSYLNTAGSATLQIAYAGTDTKIRKPLIVAEGFDTGLLSSSGSIGDTDYKTFEASLNLNAGIELRNLITNNTTVDYDVIYVNWDNGTDYIQRNAYVLEEVIKYVNTRKAAAGSTTPNVVLGQSMGGVIARYALKDMENRGEPHKTGLYISQDAPHQGANVPLGALYMARHAVDMVIKTPANNINIPVTSSSTIGLSDITDLLNAPATRQLLINNVTSSFTLDNTLRSTFDSELKLLGYPAQTRNIALSNASHCASLQGVAAGGNIFNLTANGRTTFLTDFILTLLPVDGLAGALAGALTGGVINGSTPGRTKLDIDFRVNAYPASGTSQVYYGRIRYTKTFLWIIPISKDLTLRQYSSPSNVLALDSYPGGVIPSLSNINLSTFQSNAFAKYGYTLSLNPNLDFIPATSALDVGKGNVALTATDYTARYTAAAPPTGSKSIPFVNFSTSYNTSGSNEPHISFTARSGKWLASELDAISGSDIYDCSYVCAPPLISGSASICTNSTYSLSVLGSASVNWSISPTNAATFPSGPSSSKTFTKNGSFSGNATITATISNSGSSCAAITVTKNVVLGSVLNLTAPSITDGSGGISATVTGGSGTYYWYRNAFNPSLKTLLYSSSSNSVYLQFGCTGGVLSVENTGNCGFATASRTITQSGCGSNFAMVVYPNPSSSEIFIGHDENAKGQNGKQDLSVTTEERLQTEIYDFSGSLVRAKQFEKSDNVPSIDISDFKKATYFLRIIGKEVDEVHQIIKE